MGSNRNIADYFLRLFYLHISVFIIISFRKADRA
nr:MAG TPA: hypothetical protein [Caudoviricetes sp.]